MKELSEEYQQHSNYIFKVEFVVEQMRVFKKEMDKIEEAFREAIVSGYASIRLVIPNDKGWLPLIALLRILNYSVIAEDDNKFEGIIGTTVEVGAHVRKRSQFIVSILSKTDTKEINDLVKTL